MGVAGQYTGTSMEEWAGRSNGGSRSVYIQAPAWRSGRGATVGVAGQSNKLRS